jgi:hypothetical protein
MNDQHPKTARRGARSDVKRARSLVPVALLLALSACLRPSHNEEEVIDEARIYLSDKTSLCYFLTGHYGVVDAPRGFKTPDGYISREELDFDREGADEGFIELSVNDFNGKQPNFANLSARVVAEVDVKPTPKGLEEDSRTVTLFKHSPHEILVRCADAAIPYFTEIKDISTGLTPEIMVKGRARVTPTEMGQLLYPNSALMYRQYDLDFWIRMKWSFFGRHWNAVTGKVVEAR